MIHGSKSDGSACLSMEASAVALTVLTMLPANPWRSALLSVLASWQAAAESGDRKVRRQAQKVSGLRTRGSQLLTTLLVSSTSVNVAFVVLSACEWE